MVVSGPFILVVWIMPHHSGGSLSRYSVGILSIRGFGFNGYVFVRTSNPPP